MVLSPIRQALVKSRNTIAAQVWTNVGGDTALWYLKQVGIDRTDEGSFPSQSVGGFTKGMTTLEMAAAYNTLHRAVPTPHRMPAHRYLTVRAQLSLRLTLSLIRFIHPRHALMADMLKGVVTSGTPSKFGGQITNPPENILIRQARPEQHRTTTIKWFCGFTPYYAAAVWYGYDKRLRQTEIPRADRNNAVRIWMYCM